MHILRQGGVKGAVTEIGLAICSLGSCRSTSELRLRSSRDEWRWGRAARVCEYPLHPTPNFNKAEEGQ